MVNTEPVTDPSQILTQLEVSLDDVRQALHTLDPRKAPGCDGLPTRLIVMVADEIAPCVHHIFTLSLRTANLPPDWKSAIVSPVYKERGSRQQASNYRPISLLSVLSKCLEKVVFKPLYSHLNRFLPKHQSGFRQKDSFFFFFFWFCRTWTKRYLFTSQTRVKRVSRIHHRTILKKDQPHTNLLALSTNWRLHWMTERLLLHVSTTFQKHSTASGTRVSWPNFIISAFVDKLMPGLNATCQTAANPSALTTPRPPGSLCQLGYHRVLSLVPFYSSHTLLIYRNVSRIQRNATNLLTIQLWQPSVTILWLVSSSFKFLSTQRQGGSPIGGSQ